jgi:hypothetical protein
MIRLAVLAIGAAFLTAAAAADSSHYPAAGKPWTEREYVDFYFTHFNGRRALPHLRDPQSALIFNRLVDPANVEAIRAANKDDVPRRLSFDQVLAAVGAARASYFYAVRAGEPLAEELTRVQIFYLELLDAIMSAPGAPDLSQTHPAWRTGLLGVADSLGERDIYSDEQALRLTEALMQHYGAIASVLRSGDGEALARQFDALGENARGPELRAALIRLAELARKS